MNTQFPNLPKELMKIDTGRKYIRILRGSSCWGFIDRSNGNILKAASYKHPAKKHARGNIFDASNGMATVTVYGPAYIR